MVSCTADALNGTDLKGKTVLCTLENPQQSLAPGSDFGTAAVNVVAGGGSGLIFAQYTTDILEYTTLCQGIIACVLVDLDTGHQIRQYGMDARYTIPDQFLFFN